MVHCLFIKLITKIPRLLFTVPWWARLPVFPCFEEIIAMGAKKFVLFGSCGVLDDNKVDGNIIIPVSAVRDEGTSYHSMMAVSKYRKIPFIQFLYGADNLSSGIWDIRDLSYYGLTNTEKYMVLAFECGLAL